MNSKSAKNRIKIPQSLLIFTLISFLFWMMIKLSKSYKEEHTFAVEYINLPKDKLLQNEPKKSIKIILKGSGFRLFSEKFSNKKIKLNASSLQKKTNSDYYFLIKNQQENIEKQLKSGLEIEKFLTDSITLSLGYLATKKIPLVPHVKIAYKVGFDLSDKISIKPDSIRISGPEQSIDSITELHLQKVDLKEVDGDINKKVSVIYNQSIPNFKIDTNSVFIKAKVEKFTEGEVEIPFSLINFPQDLEINTFPKTVKIIYKIGLSNFNKVTKESFEVTCDYQFSKSNNLSYLVPKLTRQSELVKNVKIVPTKIDYLIKEIQ